MLRGSSTLPLLLCRTGQLLRSPVRLLQMPSRISYIQNSPSHLVEALVVKVDLPDDLKSVVAFLSSGASSPD